MNRKFCGREDDIKKLIKRIRVDVNWEDDEYMEIVTDGFDFLQSTVGSINQETEIGVVEIGCGDRLIVDVDVGGDEEVSNDVDLDDGGMEISDLEYLQSTVGSINQETEVVDVDCGCEEVSDDGGMEILDSKISRTISCDVKKNKEDDVLMVNSMNNTRVTSNPRDEAFDPMGLGNGFFNNTSGSDHEQVSTSSNLDFSEAFIIGCHLLKNKLWDLIAGKVSPSNVVAFVKMLETLLPYVVIFVAKIIQVTRFLLPSKHHDSVDTYELASEANHLKYAFLLHGVKDVNNIEIRIQDNQQLILKSIKVVSGKLVPIRKVLDLPLGNFAHASIDKSLDKESGLFTLTIKNFI